MIKTSLDWSSCKSNLFHTIRDLPFEQELRRMIKNIQVEVDKLSNIEVSIRCGQKFDITDILNGINADLELDEDSIVVAALMK